MKRGLPAIAFALVFFLAVPSLPDCRAAADPPAEGGVFPEIAFPVPSKMHERKYLGLADSGTFKIPQIRAELIVLEVFSMYCPHCQKEAPAVNELYNLISSRPEFKDKIRLIGVGAGNTQFEVNAFRDLYHIPFPLIPDGDFSAHKALGEVRTPYFIVIRTKPGGGHTVIYSKVGSIGDPRQFLDLIVKKPGSGKGA